MAIIPAICNNCGLIFPSGVQAIPGMTISESTSDCPRCRSPAPILSGYTDVINGMVTFFVSPEYSLLEKKLLINTATAVARNEIKVADAARKLDAGNHESGRLLREWASLGLNFVACMATVASLILMYQQSGGNAEPADFAMEKVDAVISTSEQPDLRLRFPPFLASNPSTQLSMGQNFTQNVDGAAASTEAPYENRKARRARDKERRTKGRK